MTARRRLVRVPASSANLGPGFDSFAAAIDLHLELEVLESDSFSVAAEGLDVPLDAENLCVSAFETLRPEGATEEVAFTIRSEIPITGGLGSSAAASVAGLLAADHLYELALEPAELLARATELEGHPDNAAAALFGGFVVCGPGDADPVRLNPPDGLEAIIVSPAEAVATSDARGALPDQVSLGDAAANVAAAARLALGIERSDPGLIASGLEDRLHQPHRSHLYPRSMELVAEAAEIGALGASISGAGPSVLVWCRFEETGDVMGALEPRIAGWAEARRVVFSPTGADVPEL